MIRLIPLHIEGAFRDRHGRKAAGCDGRERRKGRMRRMRTAKSRGPDIPTLISSLSRR